MRTGVKHMPLSAAMRNLQNRGPYRVLRRIKTGVTAVNTGTWQWQQVAVVQGVVQPRSGRLRMLTPGLTDIRSHQFFTQMRKDRTGQTVVRPRDILVGRDGIPYLVKFVADEGAAGLLLSADLEQGTLNTLQEMATQ